MRGSGTLVELVPLQLLLNHTLRVNFADILYSACREVDTARLGFAWLRL
jgi:hypothetical protein